MMDIDEVVRLVVGFVVKSGGIEKIAELRQALMLMSDDSERQKFVSKIASSPLGSRQLLASSILGLTLAEMIWRAKTKRETQEEPPIAN